MAEHPYKVLQDAIAMYSSRVAIAIEEKTQRCRNVGMFVVMGDAPRVVPDMRVLCLDREQVLTRCDAAHPSVAGALAMFERADADDAKGGAAVFGVLFADGGVLATTLAVHDADREREDR